MEAGRISPFSTRKCTLGGQFYHVSLDSDRLPGRISNQGHIPSCKLHVSSVMSQRNTLKRRVPSTGGIDLNNQATRMTESAPLLFRIQQTSWRIHPWILWVGGKEVSKTISLRYSETASMHGTSCQHMMRTPKLQKRKRKTVAEHKPMHEDPSVFSSLGI